MNDMLWFESALVGKKVLVTGHTGFTGGWACLWLKSIGAKVAGFSLAPTTTPSLFHSLQLADDVITTYGDICDYGKLLDAVATFEPELILHLAAQPLVRHSYRHPVDTFAVNALGTAHVLAAARLVKSVRGVVCVTTDNKQKKKKISSSLPPPSSLSPPHPPPPPFVAFSAPPPPCGSFSRYGQG